MKDVNYIEKDGMLYASANELRKRGYEINPFASLSPYNIPQYDDKGKMVDLLIWEPILKISIEK